MSKYPPYQDRLCYGIDLRLAVTGRLNLKYLMDFYRIYQGRRPYFNAFFHKLAGTDQLAKQIEMGWSEEQIRQGWQADLSKYKLMRQKYLLYP